MVYLIFKPSCSALKVLLMAYCTGKKSHMKFIIYFNVLVMVEVMFSSLFGLQMFKPRKKFKTYLVNKDHLKS